MVWSISSWSQFHSGQTQGACAIWPDLLPANYQEIQKLFQTVKDKAITGKRGYKRRVSVKKFLFVYRLTLSPRTLLCYCISSNAFLRTSFRERFELIQNFKGLATGCDVGYCV